jgi:hypothetical protein
VSDRRTPDATLIEAVRILSRRIQTEDGVIPACLAEVATRLEELVEERRWVPVGERLPPPGSTVLMLMDGTDPVSGWYENGHFHNAYDQPNITHWQPLPPGPEGEA